MLTVFGFQNSCMIVLQQSIASCIKEKKNRIKYQPDHWKIIKLVIMNSNKAM